ncbi:MAG: hypothetical protein H0X31_19945, partial [Nostocaceae cyanobacterium]|nr:hypothetical protein [Nostocaceae cyanobacterium]
MSANINYNNVKCSKCGHDQNSATTRKCEICGNPLKKVSIPAIAYVGLAALVAVVGGYFAFKDKLAGKSALESISNAPNSTVLAAPKSEAATLAAPKSEATTEQPIQDSPTTIDTSLPNP